MHLLKIAQKRWSVFCHQDDRQMCQVLDFLHNLNNQSLAQRMLAILTESVPDNGPAEHNENISKKLRNGIFEFKRGPKKGKKLRVLYFFDEKNVVICTEAFTKGESTPEQAIDRAIRIREQYFQDKTLNNLIIDDITEPDI